MTQGCARMAGMDRAIIEASGLFDRSWYGTAYRAMLGPDADPLEHLLETGAARDCRPNPLFDVAYYRRQAAALRAGDNPLVHYIVTGSGLNLNPNSVFDSVWYRKHGSFGAQKSPQTLLGAGSLFRHRCLRRADRGGRARHDVPVGRRARRVADLHGRPVEGPRV
jgi:hypothetical protein